MTVVVAVVVVVVDQVLPCCSTPFLAVHSTTSNASEAPDVVEIVEDAAVQVVVWIAVAVVVDVPIPSSL